VRVYKLKAFARFQRLERVSYKTRAGVVEQMEQGFFDADLGGGPDKQQDRDKVREAASTIIAFRHGRRAVFLIGFAKSGRVNLDDDEPAYWHRIGKVYLGLDDGGVALATKADELMEIPYSEEP